MKIVVDARELVGRPTGVGRYLVELLRCWAARPDRAAREIVLTAPRKVSELDSLGFRWIGTGETHGTGTRWEQTELPAAIRREEADVAFCPGYTAPLITRVPVVLTIHDVSFVAHPEWFPARQGLRRRLLTKLSARRAARVLTVSEFSAREIESRLGIPREKIAVIRHGIRPRASSDGPRRPLVLYVGSIFNRRHLPELLRALRSVRDRAQDAQIVIVGENRSWPHEDLASEAARLQIQDAVELADYVSDDRLGELYATARAFAFVSDYEGFGLTPLEALASGVPPVVADTPVSREICGEAALYVAPGDVPALAAALLALLQDEAVRATLLARAPAVLAQYSWDLAADATLAIIEQAGKR
jgi:glycosyltransferase involved in cell wall biosynthesis